MESMKWKAGKEEAVFRGFSPEFAFTLRNLFTLGNGAVLLPAYPEEGTHAPSRSVTYANEIYDRPLHPYTRALISSVPVPDPLAARANKRIPMTGEIPSPLNAPSGCPFHTRCPYAKEACKESKPELREIEKGRFVACHRIEDIG